MPAALLGHKFGSQSCTRACTELLALAGALLRSYREARATVGLKERVRGAFWSLDWNSLPQGATEWKCSTGQWKALMGLVMMDDEEQLNVLLMLMGVAVAQCHSR